MLKDLVVWHECYPSKLDLATTTSRDTSSGVGGVKGFAALGLPFRASVWLDEPYLGLDGAKTWMAYETELRAWCNTITGQRPSKPLEYLLEHLEQVKQCPDFEAFLNVLAIIWRRVGQLTGHIPPPGPPCLACKSETRRNQTDQGWDRTYVCSECGRTTHQDTYMKIGRWVKQQQAQAVDVDKARSLLTVEQLQAIYPRLSRERIRQWRHRHKIAPANPSSDRQAKYRLEDVKKLLNPN